MQSSYIHKKHESLRYILPKVASPCACAVLDRVVPRSLIKAFHEKCSLLRNKSRDSYVRSRDKIKSRGCFVLLMFIGD